MSDNAQFWKDLLGDDYEELIDSVKPRSPQDIPNNNPVPERAVRQNTVPSVPQKPQPKEQPGIEPAQNAGQNPVVNPGKPANKSDVDDGDRFYQYEPMPPDQNQRIIKKPAPVSPISQKNGSDKEDDFEVNFDFDREYRDVPEKHQPQPSRNKRTGCLGGVLYAVFFIAVSLVLASLLWLAATDVLGFGNEDERIQVTIPENYTIDSVADTLYEKGLIKYRFLFKLYAGFSDAEKKITEGTFELNQNYDYRALVNGMNIHGGKRVEIDVTIPEGYTLKQIIELFNANNVCTDEELWDAAANYDFDYDFLDKSTLGDKHRLEGYLFPDTYSFYVGDSPSRVFSKMLSNFNTKFTDEYLTRAEELGYTQQEIVIIAAMIEKEAGADAERDTIASVIYNRLKSSSFPYLQIDATIYYAIAETGEAFSTDVDSPYNTYNHKGLPAGPIANPGIASIRAALYPKTTSYYYYALNKSGTHNFFSGSSAFNAFISSDEYGG